MKRNTLIITIFFTLIAVIFFLYFERNSTKPDNTLNLKTSDLPTTVVNGEAIKSAGAIPATDIVSLSSIKEVTLLVEKGDVKNEQFNLLTNTGEGLRAELSKPYLSNQQFFLNWLKENGYTHITPDQFDFIFLP